jgi:two-component system, sensor histidine kinase PdtaS
MNSATYHLTRCGLPGIDVIPFGTHACHFYASREDLIAALVPYCIAGLEANERCLWITASPLSGREAIEAMRAKWPGADEAVQSGALRIVDFDRWYAGSEGLLGVKAIELLLKEEELALSYGYNGLRITGNTSFLEPNHVAAFMEYERAGTENLVGRRIVALCSYVLAERNAAQRREVIDAHHCAFEHPDQSWQVVTELTPLVSRGGG